MTGRERPKLAGKTSLTWRFALERVTGIEPALSAWEAGDAPWPGTPVIGCDQEIQPLQLHLAAVWVENWVENRRCLKSVETGAAWSRSMHSNTRPPGGSSHGCSMHCRYSEYMTVMKSDCQPVSGPDGSAALPIPYRRKCSVTPIRGARIGESARSAQVKPVTEPSASPPKPGRHTHVPGQPVIGRRVERRLAQRDRCHRGARRTPDERAGF
jgi:hypothetical protein